MGLFSVFVLWSHYICHPPTFLASIYSASFQFEDVPHKPPAISNPSWPPGTVCYHPATNYFWSGKSLCSHPCCLKCESIGNDYFATNLIHRPLESRKITFVMKRLYNLKLSLHFLGKTHMRGWLLKKKTGIILLSVVNLEKNVWLYLIHREKR